MKIFVLYDTETKKVVSRKPYLKPGPCKAASNESRMEFYEACNKWRTGIPGYDTAYPKRRDYGWVALKKRGALANIQCIEVDLDRIIPVLLEPAPDA